MFALSSGLSFGKFEKVVEHFRVSNSLLFIIELLVVVTRLIHESFLIVDRSVKGLAIC